MKSPNRRQVLKASLAMNAGLPLAALGQSVFAASGPATATTYQPQTREMYVSMVPVLVHEMSSFLPYLSEDFGKGGLLEGKEVYAFMPYTLIAYAGDSLNLHIYNPADDPHTFTIVELSQSVTVTGKSADVMAVKEVPAGIYTLMCAEDEHMPFMWGQVVFLRPTG
jgi:hypothetical protein